MVSTNGGEWLWWWSSMDGWDDGTEGADVEVPLCPPVPDVTRTDVGQFFLTTVVSSEMCGQDSAYSVSFFP